jgi:hypothetical protein
MDRSNLERRIAWELAHLPSPAAPPTLLPRVMAAVQAWATRPWYERAWTTWPIGWQVAALALFAIGAKGRRRSRGSRPTARCSVSNGSRGSSACVSSTVASTHPPRRCPRRCFRGLSRPFRGAWADACSDGQ